MKYVLEVAYDGTAYGGWQTQKNSISVQQKLEDGVYEATGCRVHIAASGRTDAGVHAAAQICQFEADCTIPPERLPEALNCRLPEDIGVMRCAAAKENFDCVRSAKKKTYRYGLYLSRRRNPLKERYAVRIKEKTDIERLRYAAKIFEGGHDFKAYCASGSSVKTTFRTVYAIDVDLSGDDLSISVTGNGFLYNMVRTIVGTMLGFAQGALDEQRLKESLESGNRSLAGKTMPAKGLTLEKVDYGYNLFGEQ